MVGLKEIQGVQIFAEGKWNGDKYTLDDLDEMVRAFNDNKSTLKPALKLGHDNNQKLLQKDGFPAAGWVSKLYREGSKLFADFVDIPDKIYDLIKRKAYRKVSAEIFWNTELNGKPYKRALSAVALLGGDMPAVGCLDDILALYGVKNADALALCSFELSAKIVKEYELDVGGDTMTEEQKAALEKELKDKADALVAAELKTAEQDKEIAELREFKLKAEKDLLDAAKREADAALEAKLSEMEKDSLISPSMRPYAKAILGDDVKEYSFGETKLDKVGVVRELLKLHAEAIKVNTTEATQDGDKSRDDADAQIQKYAQENKVSYGEAYRVVMKNQKKEG